MVSDGGIMADENKVGTQTSDGTSTPPTVPGSEKGSVATEGDIVAVKKGHEREVEEIKKSHEGIVGKLNSEKSDILNEKSQLEAKIKTLEESSASSEATSQELTDIRAKLEEANKSNETLTGEITEAIRGRLVSLGVPAEKLEGQSVANLKLMEVAASSVSTPNNGNLAVGSGGGAGNTQGDPMSKYHDMVKEAEKRSGVPANVMEPPPK